MYNRSKRSRGSARSQIWTKHMGNGLNISSKTRSMPSSSRYDSVPMPNEDIRPRNLQTDIQFILNKLNNMGTIQGKRKHIALPVKFRDFAYPNENMFKVMVPKSNRKRRKSMVKNVYQTPSSTSSRSRSRTKKRKFKAKKSRQQLTPKMYYTVSRSKGRGKRKSKRSGRKRTRTRSRKSTSSLRGKVSSTPSIYSTASRTQSITKKSRKSKVKASKMNLDSIYDLSRALSGLSASLSIIKRKTARKTRGKGKSRSRKSKRQTKRKVQTRRSRIRHQSSLDAPDEPEPDPSYIPGQSSLIIPQKVFQSAVSNSLKQMMSQIIDHCQSCSQEKMVPEREKSSKAI